MKMTIEVKPFPLHEPFVITGYTFHVTEVVWVTLADGNAVGRGEAVGSYYLEETAAGMAATLESVKAEVEAGATRADVQELLPFGGARNALDCAFWDLEAKRSGMSVWNTLQIIPKPLATVATIVIGNPEKMATDAARLAKYDNLKIKLSDDDPIIRLEAIRKARPDANLVIDVNQGWSFEALKEYIPHAERLGVAMIEQPLKRGGDEALEGFKSPVALGADESCLSLSEYESIAGRYDVVNIKLDKCGGLTEGLEIVKRAQADRKGLMVGNMTGTSLSMAPAYVIGQYCRFVDIDGPIFLKDDVEHGLEFQEGGVVSIPTPELWG